MPVNFSKTSLLHIHYGLGVMEYGYLKNQNVNLNCQRQKKNIWPTINRCIFNSITKFSTKKREISNKNHIDEYGSMFAVIFLFWKKKSYEL